MHNLQEVENISLSARSKQDQFIADITDYYTDFQVNYPAPKGGASYPETCATVEDLRPLLPRLTV